VWGIHEDGRTLFFLSCLDPGEFNFSADGWSNCGCLADFPGLKVRTQLNSVFFLFDYFVARFRDVLRNTIIPELGLLTGTVFVSQKGFI
jgi:hypothetical protein